MVLRDTAAPHTRNEPDQQIDQPIGQLGGALPAQAGEQGQPSRPRSGVFLR